MGKLTGKLAGTTGIKFFHELNHATEGSRDEWNMGTPSSGLYGDERSASGIQDGSATSFENSVLEQMGLLIRATYSIKFGQSKIIPYVHPDKSNADIDRILNGFKSAGAKTKFPQISHTIITPKREQQDDGSRDYQKNPAPKF